MDDRGDEPSRAGLVERALRDEAQSLLSGYVTELDAAVGFALQRVADRLAALQEEPGDE
jgi:hypothetical protein